MNLRRWLHQHDLVLMHPGHGHNEVASPVLPHEMDDLDETFEVVHR